MYFIKITVIILPAVAIKISVNKAIDLEIFSDFYFIKKLSIQ